MPWWSSFADEAIEKKTPCPASRELELLPPSRLDRVSEAKLGIRTPATYVRQTVLAPQDR